MERNPAKNRIVILDRDGVINEDSPQYIKHPDEWQPIKGSLEAIALLHRQGFQIFVASNQAGIARGKLNESMLSAIHEKMLDQVSAAGGKLSGIHYCPHHPDDECPNRKPSPGMLNDIGRQAAVDLGDVAFVGDSLKDIQAAEAAGCQPVLVLTGNGRQTLKLRPDLSAVFTDLLEFANSL